jgi:hypothetical protein
VRRKWAETGTRHPDCPATISQLPLAGSPRYSVAINRFVTGKESFMKKGRTVLLGLCALLLIVLTAAAALAGRLDDSKYRVFCANGKVEVEQRTLEQEKNARGSNVCVLAEFDTLSDAEKYAENHGGKGSDCNCR